MYNAKNIFLTLQISILLICSFSYSQNSALDSAYNFYKKAKRFHKKNMHFKAYENYRTTLDFYEKSKNKDSIAKVNLELFDLINSQNNLNKDAKPYLDKYYKYALLTNDSLKLMASTNRFAQYFWNRDTIEKSRKYYKKSLQLANNKDLKKYKPVIYANLAFLYSKIKTDSADYFFKKTFTLKDLMNNNQIVGNHINYALFLNNQGKYKEAISELKKAEKISLDAYQLKFNKIIYRNLANYYKLDKNYKDAYLYLEKYNITKDSLNNTAQNIAISDLDKKYQTAEKNKQILESEAKRKQSLLLLIVVSLLLILGSIIYFLSYKNSKRKQKLAEQQKELEKQKNLTLLKEQEITTINAMINGQEKERKQIAEDLHDNLGSVLATLKLHFDNLKINKDQKKINQEELFNKTENLIDEAYLKVRSIAHAKNAGVIANQGLLLAVKMMADKISSANKINIQVIDFGLNKRLENSLELTIFRIIQELTTNVLKHADAKNLTINISQFKENLNIILEDDGKGFEVKKVIFKDGIGLSSIKTRIKHLKGTFEIDATIGKGTSILLNIPIA